MRMMILVYAGGLSLIVAGAATAFDAATPDASTPAKGASSLDLKPNNADLKPNNAAAGVDQHPGERSAKSIECSQKADAKDLHGKPRKHFIHECNRSI